MRRLAAAFSAGVVVGVTFVVRQEARSMCRDRYWWRSL
jgi:hypothetical protein